MIGSLNRDAWDLPQINYKSKSGKEMIYIISILMVDNGQIIKFNEKLLTNNKLTGLIRINSKFESSDAFRKVKDTEIKKGKNLGKKNATNAIQQTIKEALSKYNKKIKDQSVKIKPMLAQVKSSKITEPVYIQRKYNGLRAIFDVNQNEMYSRKGNIYNVPYISLSGFKEYDIIAFDGELYNESSLQEINSIARNFSELSDCKLQYYIYDIILTSKDAIYETRLKILKELFENHKDKLQYCKLVETIKVETEDLVQKYFRQFINEKYEGLIIRLNKSYEFSNNNYHSKHLLKMKESLDGEFEVIGFTKSEIGQSNGAIIFICVTDEGKQFNVTPSMTIEDRKKMYNKFIAGDFEYLHKKIIIQYEELSDANIPLRTKTKLEIREWD